VQIVDVADDSFIVLSKLARIIVLTEINGNALDSTGHHAHPADEVDMQLARVRRLSARVVIKARGENVLRGSAAPTVSFLGGEGLAIVALDVARLRLSEPEVVTFDEGI
jgi:hypothetical protein